MGDLEASEEVCRCSLPYGRKLILGIVEGSVLPESIATVMLGLFCLLWIILLILVILNVS